MDLKVESKSPEMNVHSTASSPAVETTVAQDAGLAGPKPFFTTETMPQVSTTLKCIINLGAQYFGIYTALAIVRTLKEFKFDLVGIEKVLETGASTLTYAP